MEAEAGAWLLLQIFKWNSVVMRKVVLDLTPCSFYSAFAKEQGKNGPNDHSTDATHCDALEKLAAAEYCHR
jgi:hypothetical protein